LSDPTPITVLLQDFAAGDKTALDRLVPLLYPELKRLARGYLNNERQNHTLQPTALVHEAYARLVKQHQPDYASRAHFLGVAAQVMRQILIDHARAHNAGKRNQGEILASLDEAVAGSVEQPAEILAVDEALQELKDHDPLKARLVEMRFFGGMTAEESAEVVGMPVPTVRRHLRVGQAWLRQRLDQSSPQKIV